MNATLTLWQRFVEYRWNRPISYREMITILTKKTAKEINPTVTVWGMAYGSPMPDIISWEDIRRNGECEFPASIVLSSIHGTLQIHFTCQLNKAYAKFCEERERVRHASTFGYSLGNAHYKGQTWLQEITPELEQIIERAIEKQD